MTYYIWMNNIDCFHEKSFETLEKAIDFAKTLGCEFDIYDDMDSMVA